jgi:hypothetical protein
MGKTYTSPIDASGVSGVVYNITYQFLVGGPNESARKLAEGPTLSGYVDEYGNLWECKLIEGGLDDAGKAALCLESYLAISNSLPQATPQDRPTLQ